MANEIYIIRTSTLREIADSIRTVRGLTAQIPTSELASALRTGTVTTTAEPTTLSTLLIRRQTLVDIADVIREHTGDTADIPVSGLSSAILSAFTDIPGDNPIVKLEAPSIYIEVEEVPKLDAPSIYIEVEEEGPVKLESPIIYKAIVDDENVATILTVSGGTATYEENSGGGLTLTVTA